MRISINFGADHFLMNLHFVRVSVSENQWMDQSKLALPLTAQAPREHVTTVEMLKTPKRLVVGYLWP